MGTASLENRNGGMLCVYICVYVHKYRLEAGAETIFDCVLLHELSANVGAISIAIE